MTWASISPAAVEVSTERSSATNAQPSRVDRAIASAKSSNERLNRSSLLTTKASTWWLDTASRAFWRALSFVKTQALSSVGLIAISQTEAKCQERIQAG